MDRKRVLVVDDEMALLLMLKRVLELAGIEVHTAASAEKALDYLADHAVDVLVTDIAMPGMDGCEFIEHLRGRGSPVALFAMSGGSKDNLSEALERGASRVFAKPFDFDELIGAIEACPTVLGPALPDLCAEDSAAGDWGGQRAVL